MWPAFLDSVARYKIPHRVFLLHDRGGGSDLNPQQVATFDDLYQYCYRVASVVGLTTIHIFGFTSPEALPLAEKCGIAFQLTNILRDVREDAELGRTYIPAEDLRRFGVSVDDLRARTAHRTVRPADGVRGRASAAVLSRISAAAEADPTQNSPLALDADYDLFTAAGSGGGIEV